jgi:hypothetical protein
MRSSGQVVKVDGIDRFTVPEGAIARIVSKAVLDSDNDPLIKVSFTFGLRWNRSCATNHKLVKTTPKPKATKKSSGELVGPDVLDVGDEVAFVDVDDVTDRVVGVGMVEA